MAEEYHYPPELFELPVETIPLLVKGKKDVLTFFKGAGVEPGLMTDVTRRVDLDKDSIKKHEITRTVLERLNERGDATLRARREVVRRVVEFEDFSACWPSDQLKAKGLVAQIRQVVNVKNRLFAEDGVLLKEAFTITGDEGEGIIEQIDGVIEIDGEVYLVEMKWWDKPLGVGEVSQHLVRVFNHEQSRGIFISASGYTDTAVTTCRDSKLVVVLCTLQEFVTLLEREVDLKSFLKEKITTAIADKKPFYEPLRLI